MSNSLPKCRIGNNCNFALTLKDSGVSVNWSTVTIRQIFMYSLAQKAWGGKCTYHVDASDGKKLKVTYPASQQMYTGDMRIVIQMAYQGHEATFDALAVNIVPLTGDVTGDSTIEAEDINLGIIVSDLSTSVITEILEACEVATKNANASKAACDTATANANTAAANAVAATSAANTATSNATAAATLANTKANLADQKATLADQKATLANEKASYAETQGNYAKTQGDYAKAQGDYAKAQGDYANTAAENADTARAYAENAANDANDAAEACTTATSAANTATSNANTAASNANAKVTELNGYASRLQAVEGKTSEISYTSQNNETDINSNVTIEEDLTTVGAIKSNGAIRAYNGLYKGDENVDYLNKVDSIDTKTTKISYANSKTTITGNTIVSGTLSVGNEIKANSIGGYNNNSHYLEFGTNESYFFDADGNLADVQVKDIYYGDGTKKLSELAAKVNNLVVIDNEEV